MPSALLEYGEGMETDRIGYKLTERTAREWLLNPAVWALVGGTLSASPLLI